MVKNKFAAVIDTVFRTRSTSEFLSRIHLGIVLGAVVCLAYMGLLYLQGHGVPSNQWLLSAALLANASDLAMSTRGTPQSTKKMYIAVSLMNTLFAMYFAVCLIGDNPWLVCATMFICLLLLVYTKNRVFCGYRFSPPLKNTTPYALGCLALGAVSCALTFYTVLGGAFVVVLYGTVLACYHVLFWRNRRIGKSLSKGQHAPIWTRAFKTSAVCDDVWREMTRYVQYHGDIEPSALDPVLKRLSVATLLGYFNNMGYLGYNSEDFTGLTQSIETRLCAVEPQAASVFGLYGDDKLQAALVLTTLLSSPAAAPEVFELPALDF